MKRFPWVATLVVLAAVGLMVRLGFWQLDRLHQKEAMIARYRAAQASPSLDWSTGVPLGADAQYRRVRLPCTKFLNPHLAGGRNAHKQSGWVQWADCVSPSGSMTVVAGWTNSLGLHSLAPVAVTGVVVGGDRADSRSFARIIADPPLAGLAANDRPDPHDLPNNHFSYAVQWFLFAATALVIYAIALRKRLAGRGADR